MPDQYPTAALKLQGTTQPNRHRVFVVIDGAIVGEVHATNAQVMLTAGEYPRLVVETIVSPHWAEVDLSPQEPTALDGLLDRIGETVKDAG